MWRRLAERVPHILPVRESHSAGTGQVYGFHPGGVNALFADGSVRFVKQSIPIRTLAALVTRNAGEVNADLD